jgi:hypothetical protein
MHASALFRACGCVALFLPVVTGTAFAANQSADETANINKTVLSCFSVVPPKPGQENCDQVCSGRNAACVGLVRNGATSPGVGCDTVTSDSG